MTLDQLRLLRSDQISAVFLEDAPGRWVVSNPEAIKHVERVWDGGGCRFELNHVPRKGPYAFDTSYHVSLQGHPGMLAMSSFQCSIRMHPVSGRLTLRTDIVLRVRKLSTLLGGHLHAHVKAAKRTNSNLITELVICHIDKQQWQPAVALYLLGRCVLDPANKILDPFAPAEVLQVFKDTPGFDDD